MVVSIILWSTYDESNICVKRWLPPALSVHAQRACHFRYDTARRMRLAYCTQISMLSLCSDAREYHNKASHFDVRVQRVCTNVSFATRLDQV